MTEDANIPIEDGVGNCVQLRKARDDLPRTCIEGNQSESQHKEANNLKRVASKKALGRK